MNRVLKQKNIKRTDFVEKRRRDLDNEQDRTFKDDFWKSLTLNDRYNLICQMSSRLP